MESAIMVLVVKEKKKEGDPIKRYTVTLPLLSPLFFLLLKRTKGYVLLK